MALRSRAFPFTVQLGNINDEVVNPRVVIPDSTYLSRFEEFCPDARYCVFQREVGFATGNIHLQGFLYFDNKKSINQLVDMHMFGLAINVSFRVMAPKSSIKANVVYCTKDDDGVNGGRQEGHAPQIFGDEPQQGKRSDVVDVVQFIVENPTKPWTDVALSEPRVANMMRLAEKVQSENLPRRTNDVNHSGIWVYGKTGVGKSHWAFSKYPRAFVKESDNEWWDFYRGEETVIIDEFSGSIKLSCLLRWVDKYEAKVEVKGAMAYLNTRTTVILSNHPPWEMYEKSSDVTRNALYRRFVILEMTYNGSVRQQVRRYPPGSRPVRLPRRPRNPVGQSLVRSNATVGAFSHRERPVYDAETYDMPVLVMRGSVDEPEVIESDDGGVTQDF